MSSGNGDGKRPGRLNGALGSHDRPASPLGFRVVLACFGALVLLVATVLAWTWAQNAVLVLVFGACLAASLFNVYWVVQRRRHERPRRPDRADGSGA